MAPPKKDTEAVMLRLPRDMVEAIDEGRRQAGDLPSRPELVRRIIKQWIDMGSPEP